MTNTPTPDLTAPEHVERICRAAPFADNDAGIPEMVATLSSKLAEAEAERDAALGVLRDLGFDNAFSVYQAARQKGGEG
ncbi:hypothetical protein [Yoonia sp.]|uniref:hypothetical protein n=1 Tax=Yoonia sp. TaxID=2212373 RepID=UPI002E0A0CE1|nr:hypothetical protein [Yoonia sp.]